VEALAAEFEITGLIPGGIMSKSQERAVIGSLFFRNFGRIGNGF